MRRLPLHFISDVCAEVADEPNWLWRGYLAPGAITLLAGRPKVGKSTLLFGLFRALADGTPFLGLETRATRALLLTEERTDTLAEKARLFGLDRSDDLAIVYRHETLDWSWTDLVSAAARARESGVGLLVVDTLNAWAGLTDDSENRAGAMLEVVQPLLAAAGEGVAILALAHQRKSGGRYGEAVRGSNALPGSVEVVLELDRTNFGATTLRQLTCVSRFAASPENVLAELTPDGYVNADQREAVARRDEEKLLAALASLDDWQDAKAVAAAAELPEQTTRPRLADLYQRELIERDGRGVRGAPFRYRANREAA